MPHGANTDTNIANGTQPNQNLEKNFTKIRTSTQFSKIPNFYKPKLKSAKFKTKVKKKMFRKTYLEVILQRFLLENDGVRVKNDFGLRGVRERQYEGNEMILKKCLICYIKTENTCFSRVRQSQD